MKPKPTLSPEQIRDAARIDDRAGAVELQKALTKLARRYAKLSVSDLTTMMEVRSSQTGAVVGYNATVLKDISTALEKLQRVSMLALQDTPAERAHREPATSTSTYDQHKLAIDAEVQLLLDQHAQDVQVIEAEDSVDVTCTPVADTEVPPVPSKPLKLKYNPDSI